MTDKLKPTPEQIQRACNLVNERGSLYTPAQYGSRGHAAFTTLADTLAALGAEKQISADAIARAEKAETDLREIDRIMVANAWDSGQFPELAKVAAIAAPYRVETDPLVEAFEYAIGDLVEKPKGYPFPGKIVSAFAVTGGQRFVVESELSPGMLHIFSPLQLAKRGWHVGDQTDAK